MQPTVARDGVAQVESARQAGERLDPGCWARRPLATRGCSVSNELKCSKIQSSVPRARLATLSCLVASHVGPRGTGHFIATESHAGQLRSIRAGPAGVEVGDERAAGREPGSRSASACRARATPSQPPALRDASRRPLLLLTAGLCFQGRSPRPAPQPTRDG